MASTGGRFHAFMTRIRVLIDSALARPGIRHCPSMPDIISPLAPPVARPNNRKGGGPIHTSLISLASSGGAFASIPAAHDDHISAHVGITESNSAPILYGGYICAGGATIQAVI